MNNLRFLREPIRRQFHVSMTQFGSDLSSGAGKTGGAGGSIREAGDTFDTDKEDKEEAIRQGEYFLNLINVQLNKLRTIGAPVYDHGKDEIEFHELKIKKHQDALKKAKENLNKFD